MNHLNGPGLTLLDLKLYDALKSAADSALSECGLFDDYKSLLENKIEDNVEQFSRELPVFLLAHGITNVLNPNIDFTFEFDVVQQGSLGIASRDYSSIDVEGPDENQYTIYYTFTLKNVILRPDPKDEQKINSTSHRLSTVIRNDRAKLLDELTTVPTKGPAWARNTINNFGSNFLNTTGNRNWQNWSHEELQAAAKLEAQAALMMIGFSGLLFRGSIISTRLWGAKAFIDLTGQTLANGGDVRQLDVLDLGLSAATVPGFSAMTGSLIDYRPFLLSPGNKFLLTGINKSLSKSTIDFGFKYTFGSLGLQGIAGRYTYGTVAKGSVEEILTQISINTPINWSGKILRKTFKE